MELYLFFQLLLSVVYFITYLEQLFIKKLENESSMDSLNIEKFNKIRETFSAILYK
jgi:hypothetical protein